MAKASSDTLREKVFKNFLNTYSRWILIIFIYLRLVALNKCVALNKLNNCGYSPQNSWLTMLEANS